MIRKLLFVAVSCILLMGAGCNTTTPQVVDHASAERAVFQAEQDYTIALRIAEAYVKLPLCDKSQPPCAMLTVVRQVQKAQPVARQALDAAEQAVRTPGFGDDVVNTAVVAGQSAMKAFVTLTASLPK